MSSSELITVLIFVLPILVVTILSLRQLYRATAGYKLVPNGMRLEARFPAIFRNQQAQLISVSQTILYKNAGKDITLDLQEISQIDVYPIKIWWLLFLIHVYDIELVDANGEQHNIMNISTNGYKELSSLIENTNINATLHEPRWVVLLNGYFRFGNKQIISLNGSFRSGNKQRDIDGR